MEVKGKFYNLYETKENFKEYLTKEGFEVNEFHGTTNIWLGKNYSKDFVGEIFEGQILALYNIKIEPKDKKLKKRFEKLERIVENWDTEKGKIKSN